jgi:hypothetical protein
MQYDCADTLGGRSARTRCGETFPVSARTRTDFRFLVLSLSTENGVGICQRCPGNSLQIRCAHGQLFHSFIPYDLRPRRPICPRFLVIRGLWNCSQNENIFLSSIVDVCADQSKTNESRASSVCRSTLLTMDVE